MDGELWDLTDADGVPTGASHRRGSPVPPGLFHVVSSVCVVRDDGLVLVTRRAAGKDFALTWEFPAGSALAGESSREAAVRELREETGLHADIDALEPVARVTEKDALFDIYVVRGLRSLTLALDPEEVADSEWVTLDGVRDRCEDARMAGPWIRRLDALWSTFVAAVERGPARG